MTKWVGVLFFLLILFCCLLVSCAALFAIVANTNKPFSELSSGDANNQVVVIDIEGTIQGGEQVDLLGGKTEDMVLKIIEQLEDAGKDSSVKAVIMRFNTGGGTVFDSFQIADAVRKFKTDYDKPIVSYVETSAASGGYLIASQADWITANHTSIIGSIGVIGTVVDTSGLMEKLGIKNITITSDGAEQKAGSKLDDKASPEYKDYKELLNDYQDLFEEYVATGRKLPRPTVKKLANGSIDSGRRAQENKLVDEVGNLDSVKAKIKKLANLDSDPRIITYDEQEAGGGLFGGVLSNLVQKLGIRSDRRGLEVYF